MNLVSLNINELIIKFKVSGWIIILFIIDFVLINLYTFFVLIVFLYIEFLNKIRRM